MSYSAGAYENGKYDGITLQFVCDDTGMCYHVHFNVERKRQRGPNKGAILPGKQFWVKRGRKFFRFWHYTCALPIPARGLTSFHDCMGKLKSIRFQAETEDGKKLLKDTLILGHLSLYSSAFFIVVNCLMLISSSKGLALGASLGVREPLHQFTADSEAPRNWFLSPRFLGCLCHLLGSLGRALGNDLTRTPWSHLDVREGFLCDLDGVNLGGQT